VKIKHGDQVVVITGKDKGKTGQVLRVLRNKNRVVVADINMRTRHMKAGPNRPGEIVKYEASINASNVMLIDAKTKKRSRVGYKIDEKGKKTRIAKQSGDAVKKGTVAAKKDVKASTTKDAAKTTTKEAPSKEAPSKAGDSKSPFWKKMGFGAEDMVDADDTGAGKNEDHSVPDQIERSSTRGASRGS
jgi:large subunit ribosomal protein L24